MNRRDRQLDILFVSEAPIWPLDQGFRIRGYHMATALREKGMRVAVASHEPMELDAPEALRQMDIAWPDASAADMQTFLDGWRGPGRAMRMRLANHQGRDLAKFAGIVSLAQAHRPAVIIGLGQHSPMMLRGIEQVIDTKRVWYAADELVSHQWSLMRHDRTVGLPRRLRHMGLYGAMENLFVRGLEGAVGVSPGDTRMLKRIAGAQYATTIRNGVDTEYFHPPAATQRVRHKELVFWGRMDFEPNIDAVCWFTSKVWPVLHALCPAVRFKIVGKSPTQRVMDLAQKPGVTVQGPVDDIRPHAHGAGLTILPMRCGAGIKNKLLEAAAMGRTIVASPQAIKGLAFDTSNPPLAVCRGADQWIETICRLWADNAMMQKLGQDARRWVMRHHRWDQAAGQLAAWLEALPGTSDSSIALRQADRGALRVARETPDEQALREAA